MLFERNFWAFISLSTVIVSSEDVELLDGHHGNENSPLNNASNTFKIEIRDPPTPTLDLASMPSCVQENCLPSPSHPTLNCVPIPTTCPENAPSGTKTCSTYPLDCWCAVPTPLTCAFHPCSWFQWQKTEDWFSTLCPKVKPIDFSGAPSCARECIEDNSFDYGCITYSAHCFCSHGSLYGCESKCKSGDVEKLTEWYMQQCAATRDQAENALGSSAVEKKSKDGPSPVLKGRKLRWYEIMAILVGAVTFLALVVGLVGLWVFNKVNAAKKKGK